MPDSSDIDRALMTTLNSDTTLLALVPNNVYWDEAPSNMTRFVIVSLVDEADEAQLGGRAFEDALFLVEARVRSDVANANALAESAAERIDQLLEDQRLTVAGYAWMTMHRESRIRITEIDETNTAIRWYRRGGHYRVQMSVS